MTIHITFQVPPGITDHRALALLKGTLLEADAYHVDPRTGWLTVTKLRDGKNVVLGTWAPGVVRSCIDVGEFTAALVQDENPPARPQKVG